MGGYLTDAGEVSSSSLKLYLVLYLLLLVSDLFLNVIYSFSAILQLLFSVLCRLFKSVMWCFVFFNDHCNVDINKPPRFS